MCHGKKKKALILICLLFKIYKIMTHSTMGQKNDPFLEFMSLNKYLPYSVNIY